MRWVGSRSAAAAVAAAVGAVVVSAASAGGTFVEPVNVIATLQGTNPGANSPAVRQ